MNKAQILILDSEPDILQLCSRVLAMDGFEIYTAGETRQAMDLAREIPLDVVVMDARVADYNGLPVFDAIRSFQPSIAGVLITSYPSLELAIEALQKGMAAFVMKPFTPGELRHAVARSLEQRRQRQEIERLKTLTPLYEISRSLMSTVHLETLFEQAIQAAVQATDAERASLMLVEDGVLTIAAAHGLPQHIVETTRTPIGEGIAGWVARYGEPLLLDDSVSMPPELEDALRGGRLASAVSAPLTTQDRTIGVLNLAKLDGTEHPFRPSDRDFISMLAGQVAIAIDYARLNERQRRLAEELAQATDSLRALQQTAPRPASPLWLEPDQDRDLRS